MAVRPLHYRTTTRPGIEAPWTPQTYSNVPAEEKVKLNWPLPVSVSDLTWTPLKLPTTE